MTVREGYVIWGRKGEPATEFRIIHQAMCDDNAMSSSLPLSDFLGPDGLVKLTSMLSYGLLAHDDGQSRRSDHPLPDLDAWVDFLRRVQVPHYEQARLLYLQQETREDMADSNESYPYLQDTITRLVNNRGKHARGKLDG